MQLHILKTRSTCLLSALILIGKCNVRSSAFQPIRNVSTRNYQLLDENDLGNSGVLQNTSIRNKNFLSMSREETNDTTSAKRRKRKKRNNKKNRIKQIKNPSAIQSWRVFGVEVDPDDLGPDAIILKNQSSQRDKGSQVPVQKMYLSQPVQDALERRLKIKSEGGDIMDNSNESSKSVLKDVRVIRRSLDARKKRKFGSSSGPKYTYVMDIDITASDAMKLKLKNQPGRNEIIKPDMMHAAPNIAANDNDDGSNIIDMASEGKPKVVIVGAGPAGLFCALSLAKSGQCAPILLERGQSVESRGKDIGALMHRKSMNVDSNFAFGEGGAGTWSDGKLTTRIGRNSRGVREVLETFVEYGAPEKILVDGSPHLGTDNLVRLLRKMRFDLRKLGGEIRFGAKMTKVNTNRETASVTGVDVVYSHSFERGPNITDICSKEAGTVETINADAVVIATGHSARDVYEELHKAGIKLEPKGFAAGFRIEHPQKVINKIQYGTDWGGNAYSGKKRTDDANKAYFSDISREGSKGDDDANLSSNHVGRLPVSSYRLATDKAFDGESNRGAYSFCMCPGGQIVPASTSPGEVCVNGMSFSKRDSLWANAALVVTVAPDDPVLAPYRETHGVLAGIEFQRDMERKAAIMGGGNFTVPVQRLTDFVRGISSTTAPPSSYRLGVKPSPCHEIYPEPMVKSLQDAVMDKFEKQMPGFLCDDALLHAVETRTSSPVRICRDRDSLEAIGIQRLYPCGEGAGFAGGIVSAAVDGLVVADAVLENFAHEEGMVVAESQKKRVKAVGFEY